MQNLMEIRRLDINTLSRREKYSIYGLALIIILAMLGFGRMIVLETSGLAYVFIALGFALLAVIFHELAHGLAYYLYTGKVKFGVRWKTKLGLVAYAVSLGSILPKSKIMIVALAPQVMTVVILAMLPFLIQVNSWLPYPLLMFAIMNCAGGCADFYLVWLLLRQKGEIYIEDMGTSQIIYRRGAV